jgi:FMN-dependent NADH-azoreductase
MKKFFLNINKIVELTSKLYYYFELKLSKSATYSSSWRFLFRRSCGSNGNGTSYPIVMMQFFGVPSFEGLFVEGLNAMPDKAQEIKENAIARAKDLAHNF